VDLTLLSATGAEKRREAKQGERSYLYPTRIPALVAESRQGVAVDARGNVRCPNQTE